MPRLRPARWRAERSCDRVSRAAWAGVEASISSSRASARHKPFCQPQKAMGEALRRQREHHVVHAGQSALPLLDVRLEGAGHVAGALNGADVGQHGLRAGAVAAVAAAPTRRVVLLIANVIGDLAEYSDRRHGSTGDLGGRDGPPAAGGARRVAGRQGSRGSAGALLRASGRAGRQRATSSQVKVISLPRKE